ncbi:Serine--tRNA ligase [Planctomycetes bacterium Poly30]|uniref:Serine--tRNA ligase n=1 Tax=Saltatorellus ferox TaxID=2528018 RepID=A0A518EST1_9BACT|nr:Serine--tRNA ligase [Planctomycetes bacterium Poly30]
MLDLKFIVQNPDVVKAGAAKKRIPCDVDRIVALDEERRELVGSVDALRAAKKVAGKKIAEAAPADRAALVAAQSDDTGRLKELEAKQKEVQEELDALLLLVPNVPADEVPEGATDADNVEMRKVGVPRAFDFEPRSHSELGEIHHWIDSVRGARLSGSRNYVLLGDMALLEHAIMRFAFDSMVARGFTPLSVPTLVRRETMVGTGYFPGGEDQAYRCDERDDLCLVGTAEVPVTALYQDEILDGKDLPMKFVAQSTCYRREAGTYGKDTKGLYRVHQFQKVEQVILDIADEARSLAHHEAILGNSEAILQSLDLPYRVVNVCGGDLGQPQIQKFDIETWMPSREGYGETHSASRFHDFQARRLNLRYRDEEGKVRHVHTLNNTVAASTRMIIALVENHQNADGTVSIPEALQSYLGGRKSIGRPIE